MTQDDLSAEDLLAIAAHDLKSPIGAVRGYIELVQQLGELNDRQVHFCGRALAGLERMEGLILSLLDLSRLGSEFRLDLLDCDLGKLAANSLDLIEAEAQERDIAITVQVDDNLGLVQGDPRLLGQVLVNLLTNAIKYNRDGGTIGVTVSNQPEFVRVDVQDNGVGIPEVDQPQVFDRFFRAQNSARTKATGNGLGLSIVKMIVEKHQGYIWFNSVEGEGSTFSFTLPRKGHWHDGGDTDAEADWDAGEGNDSHRQTYHELSIEDHDDVDDNTQEASGSADTDSASDVH